MLKDGSMSNYQSRTELSEFEKIHFDQIATPVHMIKIHHKVETSGDPGLMTGIEFLDSSMKSIIKMAN
jgi:hypothetical protein